TCRKPASTACATSSAERLSLYESGAMTIFMVGVSGARAVVVGAGLPARTASRKRMFAGKPAATGSVSHAIKGLAAKGELSASRLALNRKFSQKLTYKSLIICLFLQLTLRFQFQSDEQQQAIVEAREIHPGELSDPPQPVVERVAMHMQGGRARRALHVVGAPRRERALAAGDDQAAFIHHIDVGVQDLPRAIDDGLGERGVEQEHGVGPGSGKEGDPTHAAVRRAAEQGQA